MKHQCVDCHKFFLYPAKVTEVTEVLNNGNVLSFENEVCPYCKSLNIESAPAVDEDVSSVVQVEYAQADAYLKQGYKIKEYYAKVVTLVKPAAPIILSQKLEENKIE